MTNPPDAPTSPSRAATGVVAARLPLLLLGAAHPGPVVAVTVLSGLLAAAADLSVARAALVVAAVLTSQLSIGWSNDLIDLARDRRVGRTDKPLATGLLPVTVARNACAVALLATVVLGFACGPAAGGVNLLCTAAGWAYNLGMKGTLWSWVPYVVAFGSIPVLVALSASTPALPAPWLPVAGALLGVGAHVLNVLPDLGDDAATGVRGLPHRIGAAGSRLLAVTVLAVASVVVVLGAGVGVLPGAVALVVVAALSVVALSGSGRVPFLASVATALVDVVLLVSAG